MRNFFLYLLCGLLLNCSISNSVEINKLSGYWEIDFITEKNEKFVPKGNPLIYDHYYLEYPKGVLNKVEFRFDGILSSSEDVIPFKIEKIDKKYYIKFKSRWYEWSKKISYLDSKKLILEHNKKSYNYKRPTLLNPINE